MISDKVRDILDIIIPELLDKPEFYKCEIISGGSTITAIISCENEVSKIVGKEGRTINAIRHFIGAICSKNKFRFNLIIEE